MRDVLLRLSAAVLPVLALLLLVSGRLLGEISEEEPAPETNPEQSIREPLFPERSISERSIAEQLFPEQRPARQPAKEQLTAEQPATEQPVVEQPIAEQPVAEQPLAEQPVTEQPVTEQPVAEQPVAEEPVTKPPVPKQPAAEPPVMEQHAAEQHAATTTHESIVANRPCAVCDPSAVFMPPRAGIPESTEPALIAGAEFLFIRPHFSEAVAFAEGRVTPGGFQTSARELEFDYEPSFRTRLGYRFGGTGQALMLTYWHFDGDVEVTGRPELGGFAVDPFGNAAGLAVSPQTGMLLPSGDSIATRAEVEMNVFDLDWLVPISRRGPVSVVGTAGVRIASVDQFYESVVTLGVNRFARGDYRAEFTGAGPHLGTNLGYALDAEGDLQAFAKASGALLVGESDVSSSNTTTIPPLRAAQRESLTRTVPVFESEVGIAWEALPGATVSAGWLFQSWFDLGTSGGQFGGLFNGADDANIMSFEGLMLRADLRY